MQCTALTISLESCSRVYAGKYIICGCWTFVLVNIREGLEFDCGQCHVQGIHNKDLTSDYALITSLQYSTVVRCNICKHML